MAEQLADRKKKFVQITAMLYVVAAVPLLSVSAVLPNISPVEALATVLATPVAIFALGFILLFIVQSIILLLVMILYLKLVFAFTFLGGVPVPQAVHMWVSRAFGGWCTTIRHYGFSGWAQALNYLGFVLVLSTGFVGFRLLTAFREVQP